jgi:hypothetical protein
MSVRRTEALRNEELDVVADQLVAPVAEEAFGLQVGHDDAPVLV